MGNIIRYRKISIAVDCIIFGFDGLELKVLLIKRGFEPGLGEWSLMGGFVFENESANAAASRVLHSLTGLRNVYMEQVHTYGQVARDPVERVISISYFALINILDYNTELQQKYHANWFPLNNLPPLVFDHGEMVLKAIEKLRKNAATKPIGFELLPTRFTMHQLRSLYEAIYGTVFDVRNFAKKVLSLGILRRLDEKDRDSSKKGAFYYIFDPAQYKKVSSESFKLIRGNVRV